MFKPMLAGKAELDRLRFPLLASPKLDGIRAIVYKGQVVSRNLKPIPNKYVQELFAKRELEGLDGELIVGSPTSASCFRDTTSGVMSIDGEPDVYFYVFDNMSIPTQPFIERYRSIYPVFHTRIHRVDQHVVACQCTLTQLEEKYINMGYEGLMVRDQYAPYKFGRSTEREGWLLKLKRFEDSEAEIISIEELLHNANDAIINALGHTERSSHKENMIPTGRMGKIIVRDLTTQVSFGIGTGFDDDTRHLFWENQDKYVGKIVKYKFFPSGSKDKPRFPTFLGMRED